MKNKIKSSVYRLIVLIYNVLPFKIWICRLTKKNTYLTSKLYKDFKFHQSFKVNVEEYKTFELMHFGGKIENETFWFGLFNTFETDTGWLCIYLCKKVNVILDIGANTGIYSMVAKTLNSEVEIFAFEPSNNTFDKLKYNCKINDFNITCSKVALSNENGKSVFYDSYDSNQTSASLSILMQSGWDNFKANEYEVEVQTLTSFVSENQIVKIDLMKIDVEMHEPSVIEGGLDVINKFKPMIFIEVLSDEVANKLNELFSDDFMKFHLGNNKTLVLKNNFEVIPLQWNYFVIHKSKLHIIDELNLFK